MKVLTTSTGTQTISFIPRDYIDSVTLYLRNESTNTSTSQTVSLTHDKGVSSLSHAFSLSEGVYYEMKILNGTEVIYYDKIFCTDQTINESTNDYYTINSGQYTEEQSYDNEYITI